MSALTDLDRTRIAEARALAAARGHDELREHLTGRGLIESGEFEDREVYPFAFGVARSQLGELADLAERLAGVGTTDAAAENTRRLGQIRDLLAAFDWLHDDRQYALEAIEMIAEGGQP